MAKANKANIKKTGKTKELPGYEPYPQKEDIYNKFKEEAIDPEELDSTGVSGKVAPIERHGNPITEAVELDVPGSELDDDSEAAGNEDEENNYYSLGGDNHEDLEEDNSNKQ